VKFDIHIGSGSSARGRGIDSIDIFKARDAVYSFVECKVASRIEFHVYLLDPRRYSGIGGLV
jgi:hypothetical protein